MEQNSFKVGSSRFFIVPDGYRLEEVDEEQLQAYPDKKVAHIMFDDLDSLIAYSQAHGDDATHYWYADGYITAIYDWHEANTAQAGWGDHVGVFANASEADVRTFETATSNRVLRGKIDRFPRGTKRVNVAAASQ